MAKFRRYGKRYARKGRKAPTVRKAIRRVKNTSFKKKVLSVIRSQNETKIAFNHFALTGFNSGITVSTDAIQILPNITNGTSDSQRIGDQVRATKCTMKGYMIMQSLSDTSSSRRIGVRMMVVKPKRVGTFVDTQGGSSAWMSALLKKGGTTIGFSGAISDLYAELNHDMVTKLYDKVYYLHQPQVISTGTGLTSSDYNNTVRFFNIKLPCRNRLFRYDLNNDNGLLPVNENWVMILGYAYLDGTGADLVPTRVSATFDTTLHYEDA